ncbi:MAG: undecaprenyldiphospho-muramoylpentapeptide beta-N-acetylglucosaminyltransferase [Burkholderiaceae bacterium]
MNQPTLMIMAGGTGGHVMPGLAVADEMRARRWNVVWLGVPGSMEAELVPAHGIPMHWVRIGGLRGKGVVTKLLLPFNLLRGFWQSLSALRAASPNVVLGMGGYVAFPGGMMAVLMNKPLVVHEQNSVAGLTNRVLALIADRILEAFPGALKGAVCTGNPLRAAMIATDDPQARIGSRTGPLNILVVGGSLGASVLNDTVPRALSMIAEPNRPRVVHQSGRTHRDSLLATYQQVGVQAEVVEFIDDVAAAYRAADLVICRAGAMTVAELAAVGVAAILVPYPYAVDDHQTTNGRYLADAGAAIVVRQENLTVAWLAEQMTGLNRKKLAQMAKIARSLAHPDATSRVADACEAVARPIGANA